MLKGCYRQTWTDEIVYNIHHKGQTTSWCEPVGIKADALVYTNEVAAEMADDQMYTNEAVAEVGQGAAENSTAQFEFTNDAAASLEQHGSASMTSIPSDSLDGYGAGPPMHTITSAAPPMHTVAAPEAVPPPAATVLPVIAESTTSAATPQEEVFTNEIAAEIAAEVQPPAPVPHETLPEPPLAPAPTVTTAVTRTEPTQEAEPSQEAIDKKWSVDMSYIERRTADPNNFEARRDTAPGAAPGPGVASATRKTEDGKWKVDTGYIDHRTHDPNRLEARRSVTSADAEAVPKQSTKGEDGKWQVNMGYIDHRTDDPNRLLGRRGTADKLEAETTGQSATTKKTEDGKWTVDTGYIGFRTADADHVRKEEDKKAESKYDDPDKTDYGYEALKTSNPDKIDTVDPARREQYLSDAEFQAVMGTDKATFAKMPKWKATNLKKAKDLW
jgi:hypothetical protein